MYFSPIWHYIYEWPLQSSCVTPRMLRFLLWLNGVNGIEHWYIWFNEHGNTLIFGGNTVCASQRQSFKN